MGRITEIVMGQCEAVLPELPDESIDLLCTDPPYGVSFMGKGWDKAMPGVEVWKECFRLLKPGAFAFVMSLPRADCLARQSSDFSSEVEMKSKAPIEFEKLLIEGFLSIGKAEILLSQQGLVLVEGENRDSGVSDSNGAGKSALLESLPWALFGRTFRGLTGDEVVNRKLRRGCMVGLRFHHSGKACELVRFRKLPKLGSGLRFYVDGKDISSPTIPETQKQVEKFLGFGFESFVNSVYFGQTMVHFSSLSDANQKKVLEELLGLSVFPKALQITRQRLKEYEYEANKIEANLASRKWEKEDLETTIGQLEEVQEKESKKLELEMEKLRKLIREKAEVLAPAKKKAEMLKKDYIEASKILNKKMGQTERDIDQLQFAIHSVTVQAEALNKRLKEIESRKPTYCRFIEKDCPLEEERWQKEAGKLKAELRKLQAEKKELKEGLDLANEEDKELLRQEGELETANQEAQKFLQKVDSYNDTISQAKQSLRELEKESEKTTDLDKMLSERYKKLRTKKMQLDKLGKASRRNKTMRQALEFWETGFGNAGVKSYMLDEVAETLNRKANDFTEFLTDGEIRIEFQTQKRLKSGEVRERFDILISSQGGKTSYTASSGGERRRIDVCILLALSELTGLHGKLPNLLILDEVFDHLDAAGMSRVVALLQSKLLEKRETVFVMTHSSPLANYFQKRLVVVKEDGISGVYAA